MAEGSGNTVSGQRRDFSIGESEGLRPGEYGKYAVNGAWYICTPNGLMGNLASHDVTENEDGTITVSPSILVDNFNGLTWHGYLKQGVWREV